MNNLPAEGAYYCVFRNFLSALDEEKGMMTIYQICPYK